MADLVHIRVSQLAQQHIDGGAADDGPLAPGQQLDALGAGVRPLVKLAGQGLHCQNGVLPGDLGHLFIIEGVAHGFGEHGGAALQIDGIVHAVHVIAVEDAHALQAVDPQLFMQLLKDLVGLHIEAGALFCKATKHKVHFFSTSSASRAGNCAVQVSSMMAAIAPRAVPMRRWLKKVFKSQAVQAWQTSICSGGTPTDRSHQRLIPLRSTWKLPSP